MTCSQLDRVNWPAALNRLLASSPELPGDREFYLRRRTLLSPWHVLLAVAAVETGPAGCAAATSNEVIGHWLYDTARTAYRLLAPSNEPRRAFPTFTGWMRVDPWLPALPLLGLAALHAEHTHRHLSLPPSSGPTSPASFGPGDGMAE